MKTFSTKTEHKNYCKTLAVGKREVKHNNSKLIVYDVWSMIDTKWQIVSLAISPRLIKEFFDIEIIPRTA